MRLSPIPALAASAFTVAACSNFNAVRQAHANDTLELRIRPAPEAKTVSTKSFRIVQVTLDGSALPEGDEFTKSHTLVLPFLFFNYWDHVTTFSPARSRMRPGVEEYLKQSLTVGLGQYGYRAVEANPDIEMSVRFRKLSARADYEKSGWFYFVLLAYGFSFGEFRGPFAADVVADITTRTATGAYTSEVNGSATLPRGKYQEDIDHDADRIAHALGLAMNDLVAGYSRLAPK